MGVVADEVFSIDYFEVEPYQYGLGNPEGIDHQNIRNFMEFGWEGVVFEGEALTKKE